MPKRIRKLRIIPSVSFSLEDELSSNLYVKQDFGYPDGTQLKGDWRIYGRQSAGINFDLYLIPELRIDYLLRKKWNLRIGLKANYVDHLLGSRNHNSEGFPISGLLSTELFSYN